MIEYDDLDLPENVVGRSHESPLGAPCPVCGSPPGRDCTGVNGGASFPHADRPTTKVTG